MDFARDDGVDQKNSTFLFGFPGSPSAVKVSSTEFRFLTEEIILTLRSIVPIPVPVCCGDGDPAGIGAGGGFCGAEEVVGAEEVPF